jgi:hypothetical protein
MRNRFWTLGFLSLMMLGCGSSTPPIKPDQEKNLALSQVGELYRLYTVDKQKPPTTIEDFASERAVAPMGFAAIKSGEIIVMYGATMTGLEEGPPSGNSDEVLAYAKTVPEAGGDVLMLDRSIKTMTAAEFKAAKKAGKGG